MFLTKEQILGADDLRFEDVNVPEWGGLVRVRTLSGSERSRFDEALSKGKGKPDLSNVHAQLAVLSIVDDKGQRVFTDADADLLGRKSAKALGEVCEVAMRLSGLKKEDVEERKKPSESGPNS